MIIGSCNKLHLKFHVIRTALDNKNYSIIYSSFSYLIAFILFIIRSLILRLIPRRKKYYFIRKSIAQDALLPEFINFKVLDEYSEQMDNYVRKRCSEEPYIIYERYSQQIRDYFSTGINACILLDSNNIISVFFTCHTSYFIKDVNYLFQPDKNEICIIDIYTLKNFRNKGFYYLLLNNAITYYRHKGYTSMVMWIMKHNIASIHAQLKAGFSNIFKTVCMFSLFGCNKVFIRIKNMSLKEL